jgi:hypothetical protein
MVLDVMLERVFVHAAFAKSALYVNKFVRCSSISKPCAASVEGL